jgi:MFS transporter, DHA1 family, inner membrane transport protein
MDRRLLVLAVGMFAVGTDNFVIAGILPSISASLNTSASAAGQMVSIYALSFAILAPVVAAVAGGWSRKFLLLSALGIFVVGNALSAVATGLNTVLISRALAGLGAAMFAPTALGAAASLVAHEKRGRALAIVTAGLAGATALGAPVGTFIGGLGGWRGTLWSVAALGLVAMIGVSLMLRTIPTPPRITLRERLRPLHDTRIALTLLTTLCLRRLVDGLHLYWADARSGHQGRHPCSGRNTVSLGRCGNRWQSSVRQASRPFW